LLWLVRGFACEFICSLPSIFTERVRRKEGGRERGRGEREEKERERERGREREGERERERERKVGR
jgi:hypothetical protein